MLPVAPAATRARSEAGGRQEGRLEERDGPCARKIVIVVVGMVIVYRKAFLGLPLMMRWVGSALPRALVPALFSTFLTSCLEAFMPPRILEAFFDHPYPFQVFAYSVAFALVFRTQIAYHRYWDMRTDVQKMSSKWGDALAFALAFEELTVAKELPAATVLPVPSSPSDATAAPAKPTQAGAGRRSQALLVHRFSLMHALACVQTP